MAKQKINQPAIKKPLKLDDYKKALLNTLIFVLVISVFVPLIVFATIKSADTRTLNSKDATYLYSTLLDDYKLNDKKNATLSYSYDDGSGIKIEEFEFNKGILTSRSSIVENISKTTVTKAGGTCTKLTYTSSAGEWMLTNTSVSNEDELNLLGTSLREIINEVKGTASIVGATTKIEFNTWGVGYKHKLTKITDNAGNVLTFKNGRLSELYMSGLLLTYNFSFSYTAN